LTLVKENKGPLWKGPDYGPRGNKISDVLKDPNLQPMKPGLGLGDVFGGKGPGGKGDTADPIPGNDNPHDATVPHPHHPHDAHCDHHCPFPWWPPVIIDGGYCSSTVIEQPVIIPMFPASIDLKIVDVRLVDSGDAALNRGPRYRIVFTNVGTVAAGNFE